MATGSPGMDGGRNPGYIHPMLRAVVKNLVSLGLMLVVLGGGAGFPVVEALADYGLTAPRSLHPHYDEAAGCHADRCPVLSLALDSRSAPEPHTTLRLAEPVTDRQRVVSPVLAPFFLTTRQNHSRAPPPPQSD